MDGAGRAGLVRLLLGGAVVLLALGVVVVLALSGNRSTVAKAPSGESTAPADPAAEKPCDETPGEGSSAMLVTEDPSRAFASLDDAVGKADLLVVGTVLEAAPREMGLPEEQIQTLDVVVRVDEALKGRAPEAPIELKTMRQAYTAGNTERRCPGERVLLFLSRSTERPGGFFITNFVQAAYVLDDVRLTPAVHDNLRDPVVERIESLSLPQLRREVEEAKTRTSR